MKFIFCTIFLFFSTTWVFCMDKQNLAVVEAKANKIIEMEKFLNGASDLVLEHYLELLGDVNCEIEGHTPLVWAIICERVNIVKLLIEKYNADVDQVSGDWCETPLHWAVLSGNKKIIDMLLAANALTQQDEWNKTPLDYLKAFPIVKDKDF